MRRQQSEHEHTQCRQSGLTGSVAALWSIENSLQRRSSIPMKSQAENLRGYHLLKAESL
jgi:hypothetical protein